jgi:hypothetical protein
LLGALNDCLRKFVSSDFSIIRFVSVNMLYYKDQRNEVT